MQIAIIGLGLIGGSIAKALKENTKHTVIGFDRDENVVFDALSYGAIDRAGSTSALQNADVVYVCLYPADVVRFVEDHAERRHGGGTLCVVLVRLAVYVLLQNNVRTLCQGRFQILGNGDHAHTLLLADIKDGEQLLGLTTAGSEYHHITLTQEAGSTVNCFGRGDEAGRTLDAAQQVCKVLADDAAVAAACGTDAGSIAQQLHSTGELLIVDIFLHFSNAHSTVFKTI